MATLTAKYQLSLPKAVAEKVGLAPGDEVECEPAGEIVRVRKKRSRLPALTTTDRLILFDLATERQSIRNSERTTGEVNRGWTREELYERK